MKRFGIIILIGIIFIEAFMADFYCQKNLIPLTSELVQKYNLTFHDLLSMQYYISKKLIFNASTTETTNDKNIGTKTLSTSTLIKKKEIILPEKTPGIAIDSIKNGVKVDFGNGVILNFSYFKFFIDYKVITDYFLKPLTTVKINDIEYFVEGPKTDLIKSGNTSDGYVFNTESVDLLVDLSVLKSTKVINEKEIAPGRVIGK